MIREVSANMPSNSMARLTWGRFFNKLQNNTSKAIIRGIINNGGENNPTLVNEVSNILRSGRTNIRVNSGPVAERIAARIRNMNPT
jgi:hypothetical protein